MSCCAAPEKKPAGSFKKTPTTSGSGRDLLPPSADAGNCSNATAFRNAMAEGFVRKDGSHVPVDELEGKTIGVYCSAHWCPPCRAFTPKLATFYDEYKKLQPAFEIVFASSDRTKEDMESYFASHGDYLACAFDGNARGTLQKLVNARGIPCLAVYSPEGKLLTTNGRNAVLQGAEHVHKHGW